MKKTKNFYLKISLTLILILNINCAAYHKITESSRILVKSDEYKPVKSIPISDNFRFIQQFISGLIYQINKLFGKL